MAKNEPPYIPEGVTPSPDESEPMDSPAEDAAEMSGKCPACGSTNTAPTPLHGDMMPGSRSCRSCGHSFVAA